MPDTSPAAFDEPTDPGDRPRERPAASRFPQAAVEGTTWIHSLRQGVVRNLFLYRNLYYLAGLVGLLLLGFWLTFTPSPRGRADYIWNNATEPQTLDPGRMSGQPEGELALALFEGLTTYHPQTLEPVPAVARDWEVDPLGTTITFHLRPDAWWVQGKAIFAPRGTPRRVTSEDFIYAWKRHAFPETGSEYSYLLRVIDGFEAYENAVLEQWKELVARYRREHPRRILARPADLLPEDREELEAFRNREWDRLVGVTAPDADTLVVRLVSPIQYFFDLTSFYSFFPLPREAIEAHGDEWTLPQNIITNGPYLLEDWRFNAYIRLRKNQHYWETREYADQRLAELASRADLSNWEMREQELLRTLGPFVEGGMEVADAFAIEQHHTALNLYLNGDIDRQREIPSEIVGELVEIAEQPDSGFHHVHAGRFDGIHFYSINLTLPIFADPEAGRKLRRAMALAVDRQAVARYVMRKGEVPAHRFVITTIPGYGTYPLLGTGDRDADFAEARRLMAEVRKAKTNIPPFTILINTHETHEKVATRIQQDWREVLGLEVTVANQEWGVFLDSRRTGTFSIARSGWIADYSDPNTFLDMLIGGNQNNDSKYSNPVYDRLVSTYCPDIYRVLATPESRAEILRTVESAPTFAEAVVPVKRADGTPLAEALRRALAEFEEVADTDAPEKGLLAAKIRYLLFEVAEALMLYDVPVIPIVYYSNAELWPGELLGQYQNPRGTHPLKWLRWKDGHRPSEKRYRDFPRLGFEPAAHDAVQPRPEE